MNVHSFDEVANSESNIQIMHFVRVKDKLELFYSIIKSHIAYTWGSHLPPVPKKHGKSSLKSVSGLSKEFLWKKVFWSIFELFTSTKWLSISCFFLLLVNLHASKWLQKEGWLAYFYSYLQLWYSLCEGSWRWWIRFNVKSYTTFHMLTPKILKNRPKIVVWLFFILRL